MIEEKFKYIIKLNIYDYDFFDRIVLFNKKL